MAVKAEVVPSNILDVGRFNLADKTTYMAPREVDTLRGEMRHLIELRRHAQEGADSAVIGASTKPQTPKTRTTK